jgi:hypothetical protein
MPESLQSSPTGEMLQEGIDALDNAISELECIDCEYPEAEDESYDDFDGALESWLDEKKEELQNISFEG